MDFVGSDNESREVLKNYVFPKNVFKYTVSALSTAAHKNNIFVNVLVKTSKLQTKELTK